MSLFMFYNMKKRILILFFVKKWIRMRQTLSYAKIKYYFCGMWIDGSIHMCKIYS